MQPREVFDASEALAARIGIATGLVVVGDLIGEGAAQEEAVVGETPNLAARLQAAAGTNEVVIAESTRQLLAGDFEMAPLGGLDLKGLDQPVDAWRVLEERSPTARSPTSAPARRSRTDALGPPTAVS